MSIEGTNNRKKAKRLKQYRLRMTDKEADRLKTLSEETGMSQADVMRDALDKYRGIGNYGGYINGLDDEIDKEE